MSKIKVGKTYPTRNGHKVRILATDRKNCRPIVGLISANEAEEMYSWFEDGSYYPDSTESLYDLIISPERKSVWINWYGARNIPGSYCEFREEADNCASRDRTHVLEIITENGEPVDVKIHEVTK